MTAKEKVLYEKTFPCPYCEALIHIRKTKETIVPSEPAEVEEHEIIEKASQKTLEELTEAKD